MLAPQDIALNTPNMPLMMESLQPTFKALADLNRLRLFVLLTQGERCVCDIEATLKLPQNLISHHLAALREATLIQSRRSGRWMSYHIDKETLQVHHPLLCQLFDPAAISDTPTSCA